MMDYTDDQAFDLRLKDLHIPKKPCTSSVTANSGSLQDSGFIAPGFDGGVPDSLQNVRDDIQH